MSQLKNGDLVADRYRIERLIGVGGMGSVFEARNIQSGQRVAIKVLHRQLLQHPVIPKRFLQEAIAARALDTQHAVKVEATGNLGDGCPFIVMEFLDGEDLGALVRRSGGRLPVERALSLVDQLAEGLHEAHSRGIVHRDLKPENIFVVPTPSGDLVKVVDFGISKILTREDGVKLTQTGMTIGTPQYMPIEQLRGAKDLDGRVDVYATGVLLYEVLAGVRPYDGFTYEEVILKVATTAPAPLSTYRSDLAPGLLDVIDRAMARDRNARIGSMLELRKALAPFWSGTPAPTSMPASSESLSSSQITFRQGREGLSSSQIGARWSQPGPQGTHGQTQPLAAAPNLSSTGMNSARAASSPGYGPPPTSRPKTKSSSLLPILIVLGIAAVVGFLLVLAGTGAWFFFSKEETAPPAAQPPAAAKPLVPAPTGKEVPRPTSTRR